MFCYIESCENPQVISYNGYVSKNHSPVVPVVTSARRPDEGKSPVVLPSLPCSLEGDPVVTTIETDLQRAEVELRRKEEHFRKVAEKHTGSKPVPPPKRPGTKKILSYSEMAGFVPYDTSSPEAEKICRAARGQLMKGMAPRIEFLVKDTGLLKESIEGYLNSALWIRKDDSSPAGIVVYLPVEAPA